MWQALYEHSPHYSAYSSTPTLTAVAGPALTTGQWTVHTIAIANAMYPVACTVEATSLAVQHLDLDSGPSDVTLCSQLPHYCSETCERDQIDPCCSHRTGHCNALAAGHSAPAIFHSARARVQAQFCSICSFILLSCGTPTFPGNQTLKC